MNGKSVHILTTSANLLGFCFVVFTSFHTSLAKGPSFIDELTAIAIVTFMISCTFSFLSIRSTQEKLQIRYENIADDLFLFGLVFLSITTLLIVFSVVM